MTEAALKAMENPTRQFANPAEVLRAPNLKPEEKLAVLKNWENEAHQLQTATEENMAGGEDSPLQDIREAIDELSKRHGLGEHAQPVPAKP